MGNSFYDYVYYGSWLVAGFGFIWLIFLIRWSLPDEHHLTACMLYGAVTLALLDFVGDWKEQKEWESFIARNRCLIIEQWGGVGGKPINGQYGKKAYHCADNFIYWR